MADAEYRISGSMSIHFVTSRFPCNVPSKCIIDNSTYIRKYTLFLNYIFDFEIQSPIKLYSSDSISGYSSTTLLTHSGPCPPIVLTNPSSSPTGTKKIPFSERMVFILLNAMLGFPLGIEAIPPFFIGAHFETVFNDSNNCSISSLLNSRF